MRRMGARRQIALVLAGGITAACGSIELNAVPDITLSDDAGESRSENAVYVA